MMVVSGGCVTPTSREPDSAILGKGGQCVRVSHTTQDFLNHFILYILSYFTKVGFPI